MIPLLIVALVATNALWVTLLAVGVMRWSHADARPQCATCPLARVATVPVASQRVQIPLHDEARLFIR